MGSANRGCQYCAQHPAMENHKWPLIVKSKVTFHSPGITCEYLSGGDFPWAMINTLPINCPAWYLVSARAAWLGPVTHPDPVTGHKNLKFQLVSSTLVEMPLANTSSTHNFHTPTSGLILEQELFHFLQTKGLKQHADFSKQIKPLESVEDLGSSMRRSPPKFHMLCRNTHGEYIRLIISQKDAKGQQGTYNKSLSCVWNDKLWLKCLASTMIKNSCLIQNASTLRKKKKQLMEVDGRIFSIMLGGEENTPSHQRHQERDLLH